MKANAEDIYFTATGQEDGKPLIFRGVTAVPVGIRETDLPNLLIIRWRYESDSNGMPDSDSNAGQIALEDALVPLDTNNIGRQVLVVTGNNRKEWHWYVNDLDSWMIRLNQRLATSHVYPIEITHDYDPKWSSYKAFLAELNGL